MPALLTPASIASRSMPVLVGAAIPCLILGRAVTGAALGLALLCIFFLPNRAVCWRHLVRMIRSPLGILVSATLVLWLPSVFFSIDPLRSLDAWVRFPVFIGGTVLLWAALTEDSDLRELAFRSFLVACGVAMVVALIALFGPTEFLATIRDKTVIRPNIALKGFGAASMLLLPVAWWIGRRIGGGWTLLGAAEVVGFLVIIIIVKNESALAGLGAMAIITIGLFFWATRDRKTSIQVTLGLVAMIAVIIVGLYLVRGDLRPHPGIDFNYPVPIWLIDYLRQVIWSFTLDRAMESPWVGHGINVINFLPEAEQPLHPNGINFIPGHPHNWMIEVFAETGVIGIVPLIIFVGALFLRLGWDYYRTPDPAVLIALAVCVGYWFSGLFNFSFWSAWWQMSYMVLLALTLSGRFTEPDQTRS